MPHEEGNSLMCGIAAFFAYHYAALPVERDDLRAVSERMKRRGPDGHGEWFSSDGRVAMAHRRLSIIDLSERGSQPMRSPDERFIITFNGEIYNYRELRKRLEAAGRRFISESDTEVLLHLYDELGPAMVHELRGMFAFALWDDKKKSLFLARDPYGIKPLYYADDGWSLRVASQVKALLVSKRVSKLKEPAGLAGFFLTGSVPEPYTCYQEIRQVPAGSYVTVDKFGPSSPVLYFSLSKIFADASRENADKKINENDLFEIREALKDSISHHLVADVPVGLFLSSGIDSAAILAMASEGDKSLKNITLAFKEYAGGSQDETLLAREIAAHYKAGHEVSVLEKEEFYNDLPKVLESMDQPSIDGVNTYFVSKAASLTGLKVAMSGLGGDELFGGYPSFSDLPRWTRLLALPSRVPLLPDAVRLILSKTARHFGIPKSAAMLKYGGLFHSAYLLRRGLFMPWELPELLGKETAKAGLERLNLLKIQKNILTPDPINNFARVSSLESGLYMRNQLLRDADWAGMAHSLEIRTPWADSFLVKKIAKVLIKETTKPNKKIILAQSPKKALPANVIRRPKSGFTVPIGGWIDKNSRLDSWKKIPILSGNCHWSRRWAYMVYEKIAA